MIKQKNITGREHHGQRSCGNDLQRSLIEEKGGCSVVNWQNGMELGGRDSQGPDQMDKTEVRI